MKRAGEVSRTLGALRLFRKFGSVILTVILLTAIASFALSRGDSEPSQTTEILIARGPIPAQSTVRADNIALLTVSKSSVPPNALTKDQVSRIIGKKVVINVEEGDVISPSLFGTSKTDLSLGIAGTLESGSRLYYLNAADVHQFPPDLRAGNRIDIYAVNLKNSGTSRAIPVLSSAPVIDVLRMGENGAEGIAGIGLKLNDEQVVALLSRQNGDWKFQIVLRAQQDSIPAAINATMSASEADSSRERSQEKTTP